MSRQGVAGAARPAPRAGLLPASCSGLAAAPPFPWQRGIRSALFTRALCLCAAREMGEAVQELCIFVSAEFDDFSVGFWCGLCVLHSVCRVMPSGVSVATSFSVF